MEFCTTFYFGDCHFGIEFVAVLAQPVNLGALAHLPALYWFGRKRLDVAAMRMPRAIGQQKIDRSVEHFGLGVTENAFGLFVEFDDPVEGVDHNNGVAHCLEQLSVSVVSVAVFC